MVPVVREDQSLMLYLYQTSNLDFKSIYSIGEMRRGCISPDR